MKSEIKQTARDRAVAGWGVDMPDWIAAMVAAADATSQRKVSDAIGYSPSVAALVLANKYRGDLSRVEMAVRGAFMQTRVECPGMNDSIASDDCVAWQRRGYDHTNHMGVRMFRACRGGCPHYKGMKNNAE